MPLVKDKITIHDVANKAGVSISTVSRVLNGLDRVAPETKKRVEHAVQKLNFYPNNRAQSLSRKRTDMVALIVPDFEGEYFTGLMEGAHQGAIAAGIDLMVLKAKGSKAKKEAVSRLLVAGRVDGVIILLEEKDSDVLRKIEKNRNPLVVLDQDVGHLRMDSILVDNRNGAYEATNHLIENCNRKNLYFIGGPENNVDTLEREQGFKNAMQSHGLPISPEVFYIPQYDYDQAFYYVSRHLVDKVKNVTDCGIVAANDDIACGAIDALIDHGIEVPSQVSVLGFDDSHLAVRRRLKLTTVRFPLEELGHAAIKAILNRMNEPDSGPVKVTLRGELIIRESCGAHS